MSGTSRVFRSPQGHVASSYGAYDSHGSAPLSPPRPRSPSPSAPATIPWEPPSLVQRRLRSWYDAERWIREEKLTLNDRCWGGSIHRTARLYTANLFRRKLSASSGLSFGRRSLDPSGGDLY